MTIPITTTNKAMSVYSADSTGSATCGSIDLSSITAHWRHTFQCVTLSRARPSLGALNSITPMLVRHNILCKAKRFQTLALSFLLSCCLSIPRFISLERHRGICIMLYKHLHPCRHPWTVLMLFRPMVVFYFTVRFHLLTLTMRNNSKAFLS